MQKVKKFRIYIKKKTTFAREQLKEKVQEKRNTFKEKQKTLDVSNLVFLDESSLNLFMTRLYGRAISSERVYDYVKDIRFKRQSIISTVRLNGEKVPMIFNGTLTGDLFEGYIKEMLVPTLKENDILIMDNCSSHKRKSIENLVNSVGASILWLPPYSPDLNPIELMWSKIKAYLRKVKSETLEQLNKAIKEALESVTIDDIKNWFTHDGYIET